MSDDATQKSVDEKNYTSKETEAMVEELREVAQGLDEIVNEVEITEKPVEEKIAVSTLESKSTSASNDGAQASSLKPQLIESDPKTVETTKAQEIPKVESPKQDSVQVDQKVKNETSVEVLDKPKSAESKEEIMPESKPKFNPFGFLKRKSVAKPSTVTKKKNLPKIFKIVAIIVAIIIFIFILVAGIGYMLVRPVISDGRKTAQLAQETYLLFKAQDLVKAEPKLTETKNSLLQTQKSYQKLAFLGILPFVSTYQKDGEAGIKAAVAGAEAGELFIKAVLPYADVLGFTGKESTQSGTVEDRIVKIIETLDKVSPQLDAIGSKLTIVDSEMKKINPMDYPEKYKDKEVRAKLTKAESLIAEAKKALTDAQPLVKVLPSILGYPETKKYLVLFQNDGELRPTGGFISAFAVLSVEKGKIKSEKSEDVYALDEKYKKAGKPPDAIGKYLNEQKWFMRNMNWSPDYKVSMDTFNQAYDTLKDEEKINGIIAIDTTVLARIIEVIGPLKVDDWGTYTVENDARCNLPQVICELEHIIDRPLATLTTNRKATILGPMMKTLMERSLGGGKEQLTKLIPLAFELMEQKHVLMYFLDEKQQQASEDFNIAGRIMDYSGDYLHINNANLGGAKSNFYVDETVDQEVNISGDGSVTKKVTLSYKHNEPGDNCNLEAGQLCLSGILRSYFRVYVPKGSVLTIGRGSMVEVKTGEELGKTYFEGFYELRPQSQVKIELEYSIPVKAQGEYDILVQKQPGTKSSQHTLTVKGKSENFELTKDSEKKVKY